MYLRNELNAYEQEYIKHYRAIVFAKIRNLKSLIVDFPLQKNEIAYYKYKNTSFYRLTGQKLTPIKRNGELYITTKKIMLTHNMDVFPIEFENILNYKISRFGLTIITKENTFIFKTYDDYLPYVSLERIFILERINL
jgi:CMP-N-acetylneuraminic acid synthetase